MANKPQNQNQKNKPAQQPQPLSKKVKPAEFDYTTAETNFKNYRGHVVLILTNENRIFEGIFTKVSSMKADRFSICLLHCQEQPYEARIADIFNTGKVSTVIKSTFPFEEGEKWFQFINVLAIRSVAVFQVSSGWKSDSDLQSARSMETLVNVKVVLDNTNSSNGGNDVFTHINSENGSDSDDDFDLDNANTSGWNQFEEGVNQKVLLKNLEVSDQTLRPKIDTANPHYERQLHIATQMALREEHNARLGKISIEAAREMMSIENATGENEDDLHSAVTKYTDPTKYTDSTSRTNGDAWGATGTPKQDAWGVDRNTASSPRDNSRPHKPAPPINVPKESRDNNNKSANTPQTTASRTKKIDTDDNWRSNASTPVVSRTGPSTTTSPSTRLPRESREPRDFNRQVSASPSSHTSAQNLVNSGSNPSQGKERPRKDNTNPPSPQQDNTNPSTPQSPAEITVVPVIEQTEPQVPISQVLPVIETSAPADDSQSELVTNETRVVEEHPLPIPHTSSTSSQPLKLAETTDIQSKPTPDEVPSPQASATEEPITTAAVPVPQTQSSPSVVAEVQEKKLNPSATPFNPTAAPFVPAPKKNVSDVAPFLPSTSGPKQQRHSHHQHPPHHHPHTHVPTHQQYHHPPSHQSAYQHQPQYGYHIPPQPQPPQHQQHGYYSPQPPHMPPHQPQMPMPNPYHFPSTQYSTHNQSPQGPQQHNPSYQPHHTHHNQHNPHYHRENQHNYMQNEQPSYQPHHHHSNNDVVYQRQDGKFRNNNNNNNIHMKSSEQLGHQPVYHQQHFSTPDRGESRYQKTNSAHHHQSTPNVPHYETQHMRKHNNNNNNMSHTPHKIHIPTDGSLPQPPQANRPSTVIQGPPQHFVPGTLIDTAHDYHHHHPRAHEDDALAQSVPPHLPHLRKKNYHNTANINNTQSMSYGRPHVNIEALNPPAPPPMPEKVE